MYPFKAALKKEARILLSDKAGMMFMFFMPVLFVILISILQHSAYQSSDARRIALLIANTDEGPFGDSLVALISENKLFRTEHSMLNSPDSLSRRLLEDDYPAAVFIPEEFSQKIDRKSALVFSKLSGMPPSETIPNTGTVPLKICYDPGIQPDYIITIENSVRQALSMTESSAFVDRILAQTRGDEGKNEIKQLMFSNAVDIELQAAAHHTRQSPKRPNATQHNVPAWTLFAMFFMVVSLSNNMVNEKLNGSFTRLRTTPAGTKPVFYAKFVIYMLAAFLQVFIVFSIGSLLFPYINLPALEMNADPAGFTLVVIMSALVAVAWAFFIGAFAGSSEQASGLGSASIVIFSALGGVFIPLFVMPQYMQIISRFSPLSWSLEGFYTLFLKDGQLPDVLIPSAILGLFACVLLGLSYFKLKKHRYWS